MSTPMNVTLRQEFPFKESLGLCSEWHSLVVRLLSQRHKPHNDSRQWLALDMWSALYSLQDFIPEHQMPFLSWSSSNPSGLALACRLWHCMSIFIISIPCQQGHILRSFSCSLGVHILYLWHCLSLTIQPFQINHRLPLNVHGRILFSHISSSVEFLPN